MDPSTPATVPIRRVEAGRGLSWWTEAWPLFTRQPGMWMVLGIVTLVAVTVLGMLPLLGGLLLAFVLPVLMGGWALAARKVQQGGELALDDLFAGFRAPLLQPLATMGGLLLAAGLGLGVLATALGVGAVASVMARGAHFGMAGMMAAMSTGAMAVLLLMTLGLLIGMALWFAPALVVLRGLPPGAALRLSFAASLRNALPMLLWSLVYLVASVLASLPLGLGWVLLLPCLLLSAYVSYGDVFGA